MPVLQIVAITRLNRIPPARHLGSPGTTVMSQRKQQPSDRCSHHLFEHPSRQCKCSLRDSMSSSTFHSVTRRAAEGKAHDRFTINSLCSALC